MTTSSFRSNLVNFCPKKNLTSNGSKPIRVLTRWTTSCSDDRVPLGYPLPDFQPIWRNFMIHFFFFHSQPEGRGSTRGKKFRSHKTFEPIKCIWYAQGTGYLIYSQFGATFRFTPENDKNHWKLNFKSLHTHMSFDSQKFLCFQKILSIGL